MFESVVVDVLNRFLGDYVVNLDTSQLSLGIWGGNVTAAVPLSCFPPALLCPSLALPAWGLGPLAYPASAPATALLGVKLRKAERQFRALARELFIFWLFILGSRVLDEKVPLFRAERPRVL